MTVLLVHQALTRPVTLVGAVIDVTKFDDGQVECRHGFNEATANTNPADFFIQTSLSTSGDEDWATVVTHTVATGTPADEVVTVNSAAGAPLVSVAATAGFAAGDLIYVRDTVAADSEWALVQEILTNTLIAFVTPLTNAHAATTTTVFGTAEHFVSQINIRAARRLRLLYQNEGATAANTHMRADGTFRRIR